MKVEKQKKITTWEEVEAIKCEFCGDVFLEDSDEMTTLFESSGPGVTIVNVCKFCKNKDPEPRYPEELREPQG